MHFIERWGTFTRFLSFCSLIWCSLIFLGTAAYVLVLVFYYEMDIYNFIYNFIIYNFILGICCTVLHEGPCSPTSTSHVKPAGKVGLKYFSHAFLIPFSVTSSSESNGTNTLGPTLEYFCAFPDTASLSLN